MTHGRLQNAGIVRKKTPKVPAKERHTPIPRVSLRKKYYNRFIKGKPWGQPQKRRR